MRWSLDGAFFSKAGAHFIRYGRFWSVCNEAWRMSVNTGQLKWRTVVVVFLWIHSIPPSFVAAMPLGGLTSVKDESQLVLHYFANKGPSSQRYGFSSSHVWIWKLDYKESWVPKNWCFWTVVLEKTLASPLDCKEIQLVYPKGNQSWIFTGRTEAEALILWLPDAKDWLTGKYPDSGKDWRQEKGTIEGEMVGWHHWLKRHEFEQALGVHDGQGSLACCSPWGHKESDMTEWLNWTELSLMSVVFFWW